MRARTKRFIGVGIAAGFVLGAVGLMSVALGQHADLFYTPQMLVERGFPEQGQRIRLGGFVQQGTLTRGEGAEILFWVEDQVANPVQVSYTGIVPDLFREGQGVVATGRFQADHQLFVAEQILAKHDENYQPRELEGLEAPAYAGE